MAYHALTLPAELITRIESGVRDVPISSVPGGREREPGQPLRLLAPAGELRALAIADPENELVRVYALADETYQALDARYFRERVRRALALRMSFGLDRTRSAFRVVHGAGDLLPGLTADVYGDYAVLYAYSKGLIPFGRLCAEALREQLSLRGVVVKLRSRDSAPSNKFKQEHVGEAPPDAFAVEADGARFEVHLNAALNVGLFTDMREHRIKLARYARGRSVLNLFSYTGSLSVAAALAGSGRVTSVDLAHGVQQWARENFVLNGLKPDAHRFASEDTSAYMKRASRENERFDLAIVDPPTVSAARAATWTMRRDYPELIKRTAQLMNPDAIVWLSANARDLGPLAEMAQAAFVEAKRPASLLELGGLPPEYPTAAAQPQDRYLQLCLFRLS
jgi:23S rRNA (cytosine1962-C5)-methyltransferase